MCYSDSEISTDCFSESEDENLNLDLDDSEMTAKPFFQDGVEQTFTEVVSFVQFYFYNYIDLSSFFGKITLFLLDLINTCRY